MDRCGECAYWRDMGNSWDGSGECRRYPPTTTGKHERGGIVAEFAKTTKNDWCGEWKPRKETK